MNEPKSLKLNLGCGNRKLDGYLNFDLGPGADVVGDARELRKFFSNNSFRLVRLEHVIEHFTYIEAIELLWDIYRILMPNGQLHIEAPDIRKCFRAFDDDHELAINMFGDLNMIASGHAQYQHKWGWTEASLKIELERIGFTIIKSGPGQGHNKAHRDFMVLAAK